MKRLSLKQAEERARLAVRGELERYPRLPAWVESELVRGTMLDEEDWEFLIYLPGDRPEGAQVLVTARVDRSTGDTSVTVHPEFLKLVGHAK